MHLYEIFKLNPNTTPELVPHQRLGDGLGQVSDPEARITLVDLGLIRHMAASPARVRDEWARIKGEALLNALTLALFAGWRDYSNARVRLHKRATKRRVCRTGQRKQAHHPILYRPSNQGIAA